ncbi:MAG: JAB domain-containing protein [Clostridiales bacterium]|jgi:DNA repair protein RadC|nr:JAB domain-containing protein [Clostridiales bacterium]
MDDINSFYELLHDFTGIDRNKFYAFISEHNISQIGPMANLICDNTDQREKLTDLLELKNLFSEMNLVGDSRQYILDDPEKAKQYFIEFYSGKMDKEYLAAAFLDADHKVLKTEILSEGSIDQVDYYPRNFIKEALFLEAKSAIFVHNHPSLESAILMPSQEDILTAANTSDSLSTFGVKVEDDIITNGSEAVSYVQLIKKGYIDMPGDVFNAYKPLRGSERSAANSYNNQYAADVRRFAHLAYKFTGIPEKTINHMINSEGIGGLFSKAAAERLTREFGAGAAQIKKLSSLHKFFTYYSQIVSREGAQIKRLENTSKNLKRYAEELYAGGYNQERLSLIFMDNSRAVLSEKFLSKSAFSDMRANMVDIARAALNVNAAKAVAFHYKPDAKSGYAGIDDKFKQQICEALCHAQVNYEKYCLAYKDDATGAIRVNNAPRLDELDPPMYSENRPESMDALPEYLTVNGETYQKGTLEDTRDRIPEKRGDKGGTHPKGTLENTRDRIPEKRDDKGGTHPKGTLEDYRNKIAEKRSKRGEFAGKDKGVSDHTKER